MKSVVHPELSTAAAGPSQAPTAAVDNSAPRLTTPESTYKSGKSVQTTGATSKSTTFPVSEISRTLRDGRSELAVGTIFASAGRWHCFAMWPVVYAWNGTGYADVSGQYKSFYQQILDHLRQRLAPTPAPTPQA